MKRHSYLEVDVVNDGTKSTICVDSGASNEMVDMNWLKTFIKDYEAFEPEIPLNAGGIIGAMEMKKKACFAIKMLTKPRFGKQKLVRVHVEAWIYEYNLKPNLLLGTKFCEDLGIIINW